MTALTPRRFIFVFGFRDPPDDLHLIHYLCLASCLAVNAPEQVLLVHHHPPRGRWWETIRDRVSVVPAADLPALDATTCRDPKIAAYRYAHKADFVRLERLLALGGVYADLDTVFVNPIPTSLYERPFVLGREPPVPCPDTGRLRPSLCNALIMAPRDAPFGRLWYDAMPQAMDGSWSNHSTLLPARLAQAHPGLIHVEPERTFYPFPWTREGLRRLFEDVEEDLSGVVSIHLWAHLWWERRRRDFSLVHASMVTPSYVRTVDSTYTRLVRPYLPRHGRFWPTLVERAAGALWDADRAVSRLRRALRRPRKPQASTSSPGSPAPRDNP